MTQAPLPETLRIGHLTIRVVEDDALVNEHGVRERGDFAGWSSSTRQLIALASKTTNNDPIGADYLRETVLHEIIHLCLRVTDCDPDRDAKAGVQDVEERTVAAMTGPLLAVLRDHPELVAWLTA